MKFNERTTLNITKHNLKPGHMLDRTRVSEPRARSIASSRLGQSSTFDCGRLISTLAQARAKTCALDRRSISLDAVRFRIYFRVAYLTTRRGR